MMKILTALFTGVAVLALAAGVFVGAANASAPGDLLYGVDRAMESTRLSLTLAPQSAFELQVRYAAERMGELQKITERGDIAHFDQALTALEEALAPLQNMPQDVSLQPGFPSILFDESLTSTLSLTTDDNENDNDNGNENDNDNGNENDNDNGNENGNENDALKHPRSGGRCAEGAEDHHPAGDKLAETYGVSYDEIMGWFCGGYGFGEIALAYQISQATGVSITDIFTQRAGGMGWGQIMQSYGLIGAGAKSGAGGGQPGGGNGQPQNQGAGNGNNGNGNNGNGNNGNGNGNGKGNGNGNHGNGKGNGNGGKKKP